MAAKPTKPPMGGELLDKVSEWFAQTDTGLDQVKKNIQSDLDSLKKKQGLQDLAASLYLSAEDGFRKDLDEIGISGKEAQKQYIDSFKAAWQDKHLDMQAREILASPELKALDGFISDIENLPLLRPVIDSAEPQSKWQSVLKGLASRYLGLDTETIDKYFGPVLSALGLGFLSKKKGAEKPQDKPAETQAPQALEPDEQSQPEPAPEDKAGKERSGESGTTEEIPAVKPAKAPSYGPEPYTGRRERSESLLADVETNYKPHWVPITLEKGGHTLTFKVAARPYNQPLDGPTAQAAAAHFDAVLPHPWLVGKIHEKAKQIPFIDAVEVARRVNRKRFKKSERYKKEGDSSYEKFKTDPEFINWDPDKPNGKFMMSQEFIDARNELFDEKCKELGIGADDLVSDYGKQVVQPVPGSTDPGRLTISGGYRAGGEKVQGTNGRTHEAGYFDYSHYAQFVLGTAEYDGKSMSTQDVFSSPEIASVFGFTPLDKQFQYTVPEWMDKSKPSV